VTRVFAIGCVLLLTCALAMANDPADTGSGNMGGEHHQMMGNTSGEHHQLTQYHQRIIDALQKGDIQPVQDLFASGFTIIEPQGQLMNWDKWMNAVKSGNLKYSSIQVQNEQVRRYGDTVVETGTQLVKGQDNGRDMSGNYGYTAVWHNDNGNWKLVAAQLTPLNGEPSQAGYQQSPQPSEEQKTGDSGEMHH
jgi:hypothetical protein